MYKVFLNERRITISTPEEITDDVQRIKFEKNASPGDVKTWFQAFVANGFNNVLLVHPQPNQFFKIFSKAFLTIFAAGGIVLSNQKILFILKNGKWDLPKGKIDAGELPQTAALREVEEECGIRGHTISKELPATFHIYQSPHKNEKNSWVLKKTCWFEMHYTGNHRGTPEVREGITEVKWLGKNELDEVWENTHENLKQVLSIYRG